MNESTSDNIDWDDEREYIRITRLQASYADVVTRRAWPEFRQLFRPDAVVHINMVNRASFQLVGPDAIGRFIAEAMEEYEFFEFVILNTVIRIVSPDSAIGRLYFAELRQEAKNGRWSQALALYQDHYSRVEDRWQFGERHHQTLARTGRDEVFPFPSSAFGELFESVRQA
jgi:hypothetical protein